MDSLTQMALGAAIGELVLGRKIGNKAMFWGAVGGTLPDLDVLANPFLSEAVSVKFHRGPSHSIFFSAVFSVLLAWLMEKYYGSSLFESKWWRKSWRIIFTALPVLLLVFIFFSLGSNLSLAGGLIAFFLLGFLAIMAWLRTSFKGQNIEIPSFKQWYWFFFLVFVTHIILDIFTTYGTQALWPFTDHPFQLDNISVIDPLYTLPLLIFGFAASFYYRTSGRRKFLNRIGLILSSLYLVLTLFNKLHVNSVFKKSMEKQQLESVQIKTTPSLFNNLLWFGIAELEYEYILGYYSLLDSKRGFSDWKRIEKNHHLIDGFRQNNEVEILIWFSRGFYSVKEGENGYHFSDLRFGNLDFTDTNEDAAGPFYFLIKNDPENQELKVVRNRPEIKGDLGEIWRAYWKRVMGR